MLGVAYDICIWSSVLDPFSGISSPAQVRRLFILSTFRLAYMLRICLVSSPSPCLLYRIVVSWYGLHRAAMDGLAKRNENEVSNLFFFFKPWGEGTLQDPSVNVGPIGRKLGRIIPLTNQDGVTYRFVDTFCLAHTRTLRVTNVERGRDRTQAVASPYSLYWVPLVCIFVTLPERRSSVSICKKIFGDARLIFWCRGCSIQP